MKQLINTLLVMGVLVSLGACISDMPLDSDSGSGGTGDAEVILRLQTPKGFTNPATRSLTFEQENTIKDIYVLVFDSDSSLVAIKEGLEVTSTPGSSTPGYSGEGSFTVTLSPSHSDSDTYNLVVLANAAGLLAGTIGTDETSDFIGDHYRDVMAATYGAITGKMYNTATETAIPMWGESGGLVIEPGSSSETLNLTRAIARVDVGVGAGTKTGTTWAWNGLDADNEAIPFRLGHVYVMRPNNRYSLIPNPSAATGAPTIPGGNTSFTAEDSEDIFSYTATASATGGFVTQEIYIPESNVLMGATGTAGDANHINRTALVIGGYYDGSPTETFYRLDFAVNQLLINVLRNHLYIFSIAGVSGSGYSTPGEAYESASMNMTVNIYDWDATDMTELFLDGNQYIMLGQSTNQPNYDRRAVVYRPAGSDDAIEMRTNISLEQFEMELNNGGALPDAGNPLLIENERFRAELVTEGGKNYFVFTALQAYDAAATDNPSILTVTAGRITFDIIIEQLNSELGDWVDGGDIPQVLPGKS